MLDAAIIGARFLQFAAAMVLFGSSLFYFQVLKNAALDTRWQTHLIAVAYGIALTSAVAWILLQSALLGEPKDALNPAFLASVVTDTSFGISFAIRFVVLAWSTLLFLRWKSEQFFPDLKQAAVGAVLLGTLVWFGHGAGDEPYGFIHKISDVVHLLAAGAWIGALVAFSIMILRSLRSRSDVEISVTHYSLVRFSGLGGTAVALLILSGLVNSWFLVGPSQVAEILSTPYGVILVAKLCLFAAMLGLAAANRFVLTPALGRAVKQGKSPAAALAALEVSVIAETCLAMMVLLAVAWMGTLAPPVSGL